MSFKIKQLNAIDVTIILIMGEIVECSQSLQVLVTAALSGNQTDYIDQYNWLIPSNSLLMFSAVHFDYRYAVHVLISHTSCVIFSVVVVCH